MKTIIVKRSDKKNFQFIGTILSTSEITEIIDGYEQIRRNTIYRTLAGNYICEKEIFKDERAGKSISMAICINKAQVKYSQSDADLIIEFFGLDDLAKEVYQTLDINFNEIVE